MIPALLFALFALSSCGGSGGDGVSGSYLKRIGRTAGDLDRSIAAVNPDFVVKLKDNGALYFGMTASASGPNDSPERKTLSDLESVDFIVFDADGVMLDSLHTNDIAFSGIGEPTSASVTASAGVSWRPRPPYPPKFHLVMAVHKNGGIWIEEIVTTFSAPVHTDPIYLDVTQTKAGSGLEFTVTAERIAETAGDEFLPTSEGFVLKLYDGPVLVWSSSDGRMFTQVKSPVEPSDVGEITTFTAQWNGNDRSGKRMHSTSLTLDVTIPAVPTPYVLRKEIQWKA